MQLQFNKSAIRCLATALQQVKNTEVTQEQRLPDGMPDIGRVLSSWGQVVIRSKQWQGDTIQLNGGVMMWVLYAPEDGTEPRSVDCWLPFQISWNVDGNKREGPMRMMPLLTFTDSRSISSRKMMLRAGISAAVQVLSPMDVEIYSPGDVPEDIQMQKKKYPVTVPMEGGEKTFQIDEELAMPEAGANAEKLLSITVYPEVTEKKVMSDKVIFKGLLHIYPVCRYDDGEIRSGEQTVQLSQLSDLDNSYGPDAQADIRMAVTGLEADLTQSGIRLKCSLVAQYLIDDKHFLELVQDAYSTERDVQIEKSTLSLPVILDERTEYMQVEQSISGQGRRMADARFLPDYPRSRYGGSGTDMELSGRFQLLSYDDEDRLQGMSSRWDGNMHLCTDEDCDLLISVRPSGKVQMMSSMDEMSVATQLQLSVKTEKQEQIPMVVGMEVGAVREPDPTRPSVILTKGSGEDLWDLAKQNNSTVGAICAANGIEGEMAPEQMILIPVQ